MSWSEGYVTATTYTHGYYRELSPAIIDLALLSRGLLRSAGAPLRYLELGCGQGLSLNIHAAAYDGEFWGVDFTPAQTAHAADLAKAGGSGAQFLNDSFAEFARRDDLPVFDVIGLHGVWSWISDENRRHIVSVIERRLAPGGVAYVSFNSQPGASFMQPLRHLMSVHAGQNAGPALSARIGAALDFAQRSMDSKGRYFVGAPWLVERMKDLRSKDWRYLAHEYFNADWAPMPFSEVAAMLAPARLEFAASAHILDHLESANMPPEAQALLAGVGDAIMRETLRDYLVNQNFRRDIFIKGGRKLRPIDRERRLAALAVTLMVPADDIKLEIATPLGKVGLRPDIYQPLIDGLRRPDYAPVTLEELARAPGVAALAADQVIEAVMLLIGVGALSPVREASAPARARCASLNATIRDNEELGSEVSFLASPVTGSGVSVARVFQLFARAKSAGAASDEAIIETTLRAVGGDRPFRVAAPDDPPQAKMRESLATDLKTFHRLAPLFRALGVI